MSIEKENIAYAIRQIKENSSFCLTKVCPEAFFHQRHIARLLRLVLDLGFLGDFGLYIYSSLVLIDKHGFEF